MGVSIYSTTNMSPTHLLNNERSNHRCDSTGVLPPPEGYLKRIREICTKHGILLIFDEVITGFGRIGSAFAVNKFDVNADMITCAKGLTNAVIPAGAVICQSHIYDSICAGDHTL